MGRIIRTLEEFYEIKRGGNGNNQYANTNNVGNSTQEELASQLGVNIETYRQYKKLTTLIPELQELSLEGNITTSVASRVLARLKNE